MVNKEFILAPDTVEVQFEANSYLNSVLLAAFLHDYDEYPGMNNRLATLAKPLSPEVIAENHFIFDMLWAVVLFHGQMFPDFESYLAYLGGMDNTALQEQVMNMLVKELEKRQLEDGEPTPTRQNMLASELLFREQIERLNHKEPMNIEMVGRLFRLLQPSQAAQPDIKTLVTTHLESLWENLLQAEMEEVMPLVEESASAYIRLDLDGLTALEAVKKVTGRDLKDNKTGDYLKKARRITFVPSAHIGPYISTFLMENEFDMYVVFGARIPDGVGQSSPALTRSDLMVRLNALADDTRLRILELLTRHEELCAQDFITELNLSQSAASRHLRQLSATGYLSERTRQGAKCYSLNTERVRNTLRALEDFLISKRV